MACVAAVLGLQMGKLRLEKEQAQGCSRNRQGWSSDLDSCAPNTAPVFDPVPQSPASVCRGAVGFKQSGPPAPRLPSCLIPHPECRGADPATPPTCTVRSFRNKPFALGSQHGGGCTPVVLTRRLVFDLFSVTVEWDFVPGDGEDVEVRACPWWVVSWEPSMGPAC